MRLICPNCDAEYEVDGSAIPEGGRDVQCSNCGHAWFQLPPDLVAAQEDEAALYDAEPEAPGLVAAVPEPAPDMTEPVAPAPTGRSLDENLMAVLREEAERETNARKAEATGLETQTEMPLAGEAGPGTAAMRKVSKLRGEPEPPPDVPRPRRELLPEIEEINSSLRASGEKRDQDQGAVADTLDEEEAPVSVGGGFRRGFVTVMLIVILLAALYILAPVIAAKIPASAPAMSAYVEGVDEGRVWLDETAKWITAKLAGLTGGQG